MVQQPSYWKVLTRRKYLATEGADGETKLNRVLGVFDLTALGVGSTLGAGVYVLAGQIAKDQAGPSAMISFAIAALASLLAGICYAEFGARVPKAGSAYVYSYVCIGEFAAFVIGWNLILEYVIGTASVSRGISLYLDTLINDTLKTTFADIAPMHVSFLGSYFDFFACGLVVVVGVALAFGVETSAMANNFCTVLNISILSFVIIAGSFKANFDNWNIDINAVNQTDPSIDVSTLGSGGFFPFGFQGTLKGAATCFFGFVGFDCIATTGEEVRNPRKNIPRSILYSLLIIFLCYFGVSTVLTLMVPYYLQDVNAPLPYAFKQVGWNFAMWVTSIGGLTGLMASLFGALFPLPRVMYSMAEDGLIFRFLGKIHPRFRVPVVGSIFAALFTALISGLFDLSQLVSLLSIGTLLAYSVVAISVTILRYMDNSEEGQYEQINGDNYANNNGFSNGNGIYHASENSLLTSNGSRPTFGAVIVQLFNFRRIQTPNELSTRIVGTLITLFCLLSVGIGLVFMEAYDALINNQLWVLVVLIILVILTALVLLAICLQPRELYSNLFRVPFVPIVPAISIFINIYLMLQLDAMTWIRFGVWMAIGLPMFIACWCMYDIKNPAKRNPSRIAFLKALKDSASKSFNGQLKTSTNGSIKDVENNTAFTTQNEQTVKSLDEIRSLNEGSDDLIEKKSPNGNIFFIEDINVNNGEHEDDAKTGSTGVPTDDEKSVIAMLDDVLEAQEGSPQAGDKRPTYMRKYSIESELLPSVIETTIVATVHSSSDSSSKDEMEELPEIDNERIENGSYNGVWNERVIETQVLALKLVEDILSGEELWRAIEGRLGKLEEINEKSENYKSKEKLIPIVDSEKEDQVILRRNHQKMFTELLNATNKKGQPASVLKSAPNSRPRSLSGASVDSFNSVDDPIHSDTFKNRLSKLILQPRPPTTPAVRSRKELNFQTSGENETIEAPIAQRKLRHSKSETDMGQMLSATQATAAVVDSSEAKEVTPSDNNIPKAPKFDPVLYKTINNLNTLKRSRPTLEKMLKDDELSRKRANETPSIQEPEVPFKQKLEAILQRGPSHRLQKRPDEFISRRPKSVGPGILDKTSSLDNKIHERLSQPTETAEGSALTLPVTRDRRPESFGHAQVAEKKSEDSSRGLFERNATNDSTSKSVGVPRTSDPQSVISEARRTLRPVKNSTTLLS